MSTAAALLAQARDLQAGTGSSRIASWIARAALEEAVDDLLRAQDCDPGTDSSMRSRLSCVQSLYADRPEVAEAAEYAWSGLSQASHQHAYLLDAVPSEVAHLMDLVGRVVSEQH
ncbi:hypothetical protein ABIE44_002747 [Marmoricola sp. OAE513]|uniref:hypothetical protein n=1 Tax=Marmoricola sp. OAE513 TaxID=2817894 RepID=UPI001AE29EBD